MKRKLISLALILCFILPCAIMFSACEIDPKFKIKQGVAQNSEATINYMMENVYNQMPSGTYSVKQIKSKKSGFNYYVQIGTVGRLTKVKTLEFDDTVFKKDQEFELSIGNSAFIKDKCFYEKDNKLYVAAPIILFEANGEDEIEINGEDFDFEIFDESNNLRVLSAKAENSGLTVTNGSKSGVFNVTLNDLKTYIAIDIENTVKTDVVLTKKEVKKGFDKTIGYGFTGMDGTEQDPCLAFYPCGYSNSAITSEIASKHNGKIIEFDIYVLHKGVASVEFQIQANA